jgi:hypothetical protein
LTVLGRRWQRRLWRSDKDDDVERVSPALYERLGAHASADLVVLLDAARQEWARDVTTTIVDRFERRLTEEIAGVKMAIAGLRTEMQAGDSSLRLEIAGLRADMHAGRNDLLKWMIVFWVTQLMAIGGLLAAMLRLAA